MCDTTKYINNQNPRYWHEPVTFLDKNAVIPPKKDGNTFAIVGERFAVVVVWDSTLWKVLSLSDADLKEMFVKSRGETDLNDLFISYREFEKFVSNWVNILGE